MKTNGRKRTTEELLSLGMALHADRDTMEMRIRGIFSRERSMRIAAVSAVVLTMALAIACFTTACLPVTRSAAEAEKLPTASPEVIIADTAEEALLRAGVSEEEIGSLLHFDGYAWGALDGDTVTVTDGTGGKHTFTVVDEGIRAGSEPIPEGKYAAPQDVAENAAEAAVTIWGDAAPSSEIHINMYTGDGLELVYYGIGFGGTPFETDGIYGYADAATGTVLYLDANIWQSSMKRYGNDFINGKIRDWEWDDMRYAEAHTSDKALATAMELIRSSFNTAEIVPRDPDKWDGGSHTDGEQIDWQGGYEAVVDTYIRMSENPCYYVQVAVPLEEGPEPCITIFGCYPLGWEYCCNQIHDPAVLKQELAEMEAVRQNNGRYVASGSQERTYDVFDEKRLNDCADFAVRSVGQKFYLADNTYDKEFIEEQGKERIISIGFIDVSLGTADPWSVQWLNLTTPEEVTRCALRGQTLEFSGIGLWAVYVGNGQCVYAKAEPGEATGIITQASVADMMQGTACHLQINDYMAVSPAVEALLDPSEAGVPAAADGTLSMYADRAEALQGTTFTPMADEWRQGDDPAEYQKIFLVRIGAYLDDGFEDSDPILDSAKVDAMAKRGNVLRFESNGQFYYAIYLGDGVMAYADAERMIVRNAYVADWLKDKEGKPDCTCCILTWH